MISELNRNFTLAEQHRPLNAFIEYSLEMIFAEMGGYDPHASKCTNRLAVCVLALRIPISKSTGSGT